VADFPYMRKIALSSLVCSFLFVCTASHARDPDVEMVKNMPRPFSTSYHCSDLVHVANRLRGFGKERSLTILEADLRENPYDNAKVLLICRLLFRNPAGWKAPVLGVAVPEAGIHGISKFPLFPLAISQRVPFVLLRGYELSGREESAGECIELCRSFPMVSDYLPDNHYEAAARALIKSKEFKWLYSDHDAWFAMSKLILRQARNSVGE
jgi:hypothetical protein